MDKEREGNVEEDVVLSNGLVWLGFGHHFLQRGEYIPHYSGLSMGEGNVGGSSWFHGWS